MLALLYDVHGNLEALEAVIADAEAAGADGWLLGGDYAAFGPRPAETVARLRELAGARWIRGNTERWLADDSELPRDAPPVAALAAARELLGASTVTELATLPAGLTLGAVHACHASPLHDMESFGVEVQQNEDRLLDGVRARRVVFGHTHVQFRRVRDDGVELVNPGSVGMPLDGDPRAAYALLHEDDRVESRRVAYDHASAATDLVARFPYGWAQVFANRIRQARL